MFKNKKTNAKAITPIVATILLVVVAVILITVILSWGKGFTNTSLSKTQDFGKLKPADASSFVYSKSYSEGTMQFTYSPPESIKSEEIIITHYQILELPEVEPIPLAESYTLRESTNILPLNCLYEHSLSSPNFTIQLITEDNTYISIKQRDPGLVCTSGGVGTEADPIIVCNAEDLNDVRTDLDANYSLGKDIDLYCFSRQLVDGWGPIGTQANKFTGSFNGNNHIISNLYINDSDGSSLGLFGYIATPANISNLGLEDLNISGFYILGGLLGQMDSGEITDCYTTGNIYEISGSGNIGGLIGGKWGGNINNSYSEVNVYGSLSQYSFFLGGLIGQNFDGDVNNCYATGFVSGKASVGGFTGYNTGAIYKSYATGDVNVLTNFADAGGGFVGENSGIIMDSYSLGDVTRLSGTGIYFGGFVGYDEISVTNSYSTGRVIYAGTTNPTNRGFSYSSVSSSDYWDMNTSLQTTSGGGAVGKTTAQMKTQSTFTDWDFSGVWSINEGTTYPYLRNNTQDPLPQ